MFKEKALPIVLFCFIVMVASAVMQFQNPDSNLFDGGFIIAVLMTIFLKEDNSTRFFGFAGIVMILLSSFYLQDTNSFKQILLQRIFSAAILLMTIVLVLYLKRLYRSLESEERQVAALFEYATEGIILTNDKSEIILVNPEALNLFGYDKDEIMGKPIEVLIPKRYQPNHKGYRDNFVKHPSSRKMGQGRELFAARKDGSEFPVEISLSHYKEKGKSFSIAFIIDITSRKEAEKTLVLQKEKLEKITEDVKKLNTQLEYKVEERTIILKEALNKLEESQKELEDSLSKEKELNEIKSRFVSMASHEFRTPLSTVLSSASLISKYKVTQEQPQRDKHTDRIKKSVKHLNDLLEDFLSVGKLEEGRVMVQAEEWNVAEWVEDIYEELAPSLKPLQEIIINKNGDECFYTDKRLMKHVLLNVLGNAIKFTEGDKPIYLTVETGATMRLVVKDNGIGISKEDQQHLFTSFFRGKNAVNIQGTGLGLHIVQRYVYLLKGSIDLVSELGVGTTITIVVPRWIEEIS